MKVQILDRCPHCFGESMVFVRREFDANGKSFDSYRPCYQCHGTGQKVRWVSLQEFAKLLDDALSLEPNLAEFEAQEPTTAWEANRDAASYP